MIFPMFIRRPIVAAMEAYLHDPQAVVVTGMRQTGKTTILRHLYQLVKSENKAFFDFENPLHTRYFDLPDFDAVLPGLARFGIDARKKAYLFIDEVQNLPVVSRVMKYLIDHHQTKFFVTGSSSFYLKHLFPESLVGRKVVFELFPLTFGEFLTFKGVQRVAIDDFSAMASAKTETESVRLTPLYDEYLTFGGFPGVVGQPDIGKKKRMLEDIFKSYFEQDVKTLADAADRRRLRDVVFLLIPRIGSRVEINKLATELSVTREKVYGFLEFLEQTYLISLLPRFSRSVDRSAAGRRKLFFADVGLARFLGDLSAGQILEQGVFQTLRPFHKLVYFFRRGREVDFIVDGKTALEVKMTASRVDIYRLQKLAGSLGQEQSFVVSTHWFDHPQVIIASSL